MWKIYLKAHWRWVYFPHCFLRKLNVGHSRSLEINLTPHVIHCCKCMECSCIYCVFLASLVFLRRSWPLDMSFSKPVCLTNSNFDLHGLSFHIFIVASPESSRKNSVTPPQTSAREPTMSSHEGGRLSWLTDSSSGSDHTWFIFVLPVLDPGLADDRSSVDVCWINEWVRKSANEWMNYPFLEIDIAWALICSREREIHSWGKSIWISGAHESK